MRCRSCRTSTPERRYAASPAFPWRPTPERAVISTSTLDYHVGYTKGTYYKPYDYNSSFDNIDPGSGKPASANVFYDNTTLPNWPVVRTLPGTASNGTVTVNPADPTGYALTGLSTQSQHSDDHEWGIGANLTLPTHFTEHADEQFKFGLNARLRNKTGDLTSSSVTSVPTLPLASVATGPGLCR